MLCVHACMCACADVNVYPVHVLRYVHACM